MRAYLIYILLIAFSSIYSQTQETEPPDLSIERLLTMPLSITVEGKQLILEPSMTINFMPSIPPSPKTVRTYCYLTTVDRSELPPTLEADAIWIVYKRGEIYQHPNNIKPIKTDTTTRIFKSWLTKGAGYDYKNKKLYRASEGNFLGVGSAADLIVRIKDARDNTWYIRARTAVRRVE